ncbi:MAG TPA: filamentous hemagglutinin N-terminal domain-containing protein [Sphingopyxis sp.]|nr:filamentous hemagglutinin N-terminal domain-containing protein [Sphingopyxis sp.]
MTRISTKTRTRMLISTAIAATVLLPLPAAAQLVTPGDLNGAREGLGDNPNNNIGGKLRVTGGGIGADRGFLNRGVLALWERFNVPDGTRLDIINDSGAARASLLNRVVGATSSDLGGTIVAPNVDLWVINQNGIFFGPNTSISSASFVASTLNVTNADFFNGDSTTRFSGSSVNAISGGGANASFTTGGSLWFVSQAISLDAKFSSANETVAFVLAEDVTVGFTPGSPLTYTVSKGTTVGTHTVAGSIAGQRVDLRLTAAGAVDSLLNIDATIAANAASPTVNGVRIYAETKGTGTASAEISRGVQSAAGVEIAVKNDLTAKNITTTAGGIDIRAGGAVTTRKLDAAGALTIGGGTRVASAAIGGDISATTVTIRTVGDLSAKNVKSTAGAIGLDAGGAIKAQTIDAAAGAGLTAGGDIHTRDLIAAGAIAATSGGALFADAVTAGGAVDLRAATSIRTTAIDAVDAVDLTAGADIRTLGIDTDGALTATGGLVTFDGDVSASDVTVQASTRLISNGMMKAGTGAIDIAAGSVIAGALSAETSTSIAATNNVKTDKIDAGSFIDVASTGGALNLGALTAGDRVDLAAANNIRTGNIAATGAGATVDIETVGTVTTGAIDSDQALTIGALAPVQSVTIQGAVSSSAVTIQSAGKLAAQDVASTNGDVRLDAGTTITTGAIDATGGALFVGANIEPASVAFGGNASASAVTVDVRGALKALDITATTAAIDIAAGSVIADALTAATSVSIAVTNNVKTDTIDAGSFIDVASTGGALNLGALTAGDRVDLAAAKAIRTGNIAATGAGATVDIETAGTVTTGAIASDQALTIGAVAPAKSVTIQGDVSSAAVTIRSAGTLAAQDIASTGGDVRLDAGLAVTTGAINTTGGDLFVGAEIEPTSVAFGGDVLASAVTIKSKGAVNALIVDPDDNIILKNITATTGAINVNAGPVTAGTLSAATDVMVVSGGVVTVQDIVADAGAIDIAAKALRAQQLTAGTTATLLTSGNAVTTGIGAGGAIDAESTGGKLDLGTIASDGMVELDAAKSITTAAITADDALSVGANIEPTSVTFTGDVSASDVTIKSRGAVNAQIIDPDDVIVPQNITATDGAIDIAAQSLNAGQLTAAAATPADATVTLLTSGNATTTGITAGGAIKAESTAQSLNLGALDAGGSIDLDAAKAVTTGTIDAGDTVAIDAGGSVTTAAITSGGALTVGTAQVPSAVTFGGDVSSAAVTVTTSGALNAQNVTATTGAITLNSASLSAQQLTADPADTAGATVTLLTSGAATTTGIRAGGAIDVESTGGALDLGTIDSDATVALDAKGNVTTGAIRADGALTVGVDRRPASVTFGGDVSAEAVTVKASSILTAANIEATTGGIDLDAAALAALELDAATTVKVRTIGNAGTTEISSGNGPIDVRSTQGSLDLGVIDSGAGVELHAGAAGSVRTAAIDADGALRVVAPLGVTFTGDASAASIDVDAVNGSLNVQGLTSTSGAIDLDAAGDIETGAVLSAGALRIGQTTKPQDVVFRGDVSATTVTIDAARNVGPRPATDPAFGITARTGAIDIEALTLTAALLDAATTVTIATGADVKTAGIDADGAIAVTSGNGALDLGVLGSRAGIDLTAANGKITAGQVNATQALTTRSADIDLNGEVTAATVRLVATRAVGVGAGVAGNYALTETELNRINTADLVIDAGTNAINIGTVSIDGNAGSSRLMLATGGDILVDGDVKLVPAGSANRVVALGNPNALANQIFVNINKGSLDLGQATLELSAKNIVAGSGILLGQARTGGAFKDSDEIALTLVGNANSELYSPQIGGAPIDKVYLRTGNLIVRYDNVALFQNTGLGGDSRGVVIGSEAAPGTLQLLPTGAQNAFALFGEVNTRTGPNAAILPPTVIVVNNNNETPNSRINGCIIGSGAGCLTSIVGIVVTDLRDETISLLRGGGDVAVPFDPLVGTNNEGLFSDVGTEEECPKDSQGMCITVGETR